MGKRIQTYFRRPDGTPWPRASVLLYASDRIREASENGTGLRLSAEEVRALDWAVIRLDGGVDDTGWRESEYNDPPLSTTGRGSDNG